MTVTKCYMDDPTLEQYFGTAAERAAMSTSDVPVGSKFYESDTAKNYVWDGTNWGVWKKHTIT